MAISKDGRNEMTNPANAILEPVRSVSDSSELFDFFRKVLDATDTLVLAARDEEREQCAKIAESMRDDWGMGPVTDNGYMMARSEIAAEIRKDRGGDPPQAETK